MPTITAEQLPKGSQIRANKVLRILYISPEAPFGDAFGGQLRTLQVGRALKDVGEVSNLVVASSADTGAASEGREAEFKVEPRICAVPAPNSTVVQKLRRLFDLSYTNVHGCAASIGDIERLRAMLPHYDLVWILNSRTPNILGQWHWPRAHLDIDDLPSTYLRSEARNGTNPVRRMKASAEKFLLKRRELAWRKRFTTLSVCSEEDRRYLGGGDEIHVIPNGFERPAVPPVRDPATAPPRIGFIGLCTYAPNRNGVRWFLDRCWPAILQEIPDIRFRLAGKGAEALIDSADRNVDALGWIGDAAAEIATWSAMVIPIRFGGGTRVKIADAFSRKCPVVSTDLGAFGYAVKNGEELLLADDPAAFAKACVSLIRDPARGVALAERAHAAFLDKWTWDAIAPRVWAAAEDCLRRGRDQRTPVVAERNEK